jgi:hypothetical protein
MGVTIHYEGTLRDQGAYERLVVATEAFAASQGWRTEPIRKVHATLSRFVDEEERIYEGPTAGLTVFPHEQAEPVELEFDDSLFTQGYTKTQFAPADIHVKVVELLRVLEPLFVELKVYDEGEYWETRDLTRLRSHIGFVDEALAAMGKGRGPG